MKRGPIKNILLCFGTMAFGFPILAQPASWSQQSAPLQAYHQWHRALDASPELGDAFLFAKDYGPQELQDSVKALLAFGADETPFFVEQYRHETNGLRLYRLTKLLNKISGINLYAGHEREVFAELPKHRDKFIAEWDSGKFQVPDEKLQDLRQHTTEPASAHKVNVKNTLASRRYGVYGIPFLVRELRKTNSAELFATFLIITDHQDLYAQYLEKPEEMFTTVKSKLAFIKRWHERGPSKLKELGRVNDILGGTDR